MWYPRLDPDQKYPGSNREYFFRVDTASDQGEGCLDSNTYVNRSKGQLKKEGGGAVVIGGDGESTIGPTRMDATNTLNSKVL